MATPDAQQRWLADIKPYIERGLKCSLWGHDAKGMNRDELLAFIGFLDELATHRHEDIREEQ